MPRPFLRSCLASAGLVLLAGALWAGCSEESNPVDPDLYDGHRPLDILRVTQSFTPEIQWVGGRVAAVGINRGDVAALDASLVWLRTAPDNSISSFVAVGPDHDRDLVASFGGTPLDSLADGETYTFWLAEADAFAARLDSAAIAPGSFADTTLTMQLVMRGIPLGDPSMRVQFRIVRDERLVESRYVVAWEPAVPFQRMAVRVGSGGGFDNLRWDVLIPEGESGAITPPVVLGQTPPGAQEVIPFEGFEVDDELNPPGDSTDVSAPAHTLWAVTDSWTGVFNPVAPGLAYYVMNPCNFDIDSPCPPLP